MQHGNGKIANLPEHIRDELNWRINDGAEGKELVVWLNAKPEVIDVVTKLFDGKPISEQNLSLWRTHGYLRWHAYHVVMRETCELAQNSGVVKASGIDCEKMLGALKANYASMIQSWMVTPTDQMTYRMEVFKNLTAGVLAISRDEIQRERLELLRQKQADKSDSSASSRTSRSPDHGSSKSTRPSEPERLADAPNAAESHETETATADPAKAEPASPQPPPPVRQAPELPKPVPAPPPQPAALVAPTTPRTPPDRDRRGRYGLL